MREKIYNALLMTMDQDGEPNTRKALLELDDMGINVAQGHGNIQQIFNEELRKFRY